MTYFHDRLEEIKKHGSIDFLKIKFGLGEIILKLVDTSDETVSLLYNLRKKYRKMFATDFEMTEDKTRNWIKNLILGNTGRILFMIYFDNKKIGCIGNGGYDEKNNSSRLDNMMKDPLCNLSGAMTIVEKVYLKWMFDDLKLSKITGFLFSDNSRMINIHKKCGWITVDVVPIKKIFTEEETRWEEITTKPNNENVGRYFNKIELTRENIMKNFDDIKYRLLV
jgi:RimJ/RimL family protein N-acetyltransferase